MPCWGWRARIGFHAGELLAAQVDLRLVPELDPVVGQRLVEAKPGGAARRRSEPELMDDLDDGVGLERLLEHRQHAEQVLSADALDVFEHGAAAVAYQLHRAAKAGIAERDHRFGVDGFDRNVVE
jgi:hypothetical protein